MRKLTYAVLLGLMLCACGKQESPLSYASKLPVAAVDKRMAPREEAAADAEAAPAPAAEGGAPSAQVARHVELHHDIAIEVPADKLEAVWRTRLDACRLPACEVVSATVENQRDTAGSAQLSLRIVPAQAGKLLETLEGLGRVTRHEMSQTDRTNEVVDYQARLANQKALRDRLRALVAGRVDKVHDLLEVERELARVQGEIDSLEGQIRATLAVTDKINFEISFHAPVSIAHPGTWSPVRYAWSEAGSTFAGSIAVLLYVVAGGLPWLAVLWLVIWGLRRLWRWRKAARAGSGKGKAAD
jgi:hypothetical protein